MDMKWKNQSTWKAGNGTSNVLWIDQTKINQSDGKSEVWEKEGSKS